MNSQRARQLSRAAASVVRDTIDATQPNTRATAFAVVNKVLRAHWLSLSVKERSAFGEHAIRAWVIGYFAALARTRRTMRESDAREMDRRQLDLLRLGEIFTDARAKLDAAQPTQ